MGFEVKRCMVGCDRVHESLGESVPEGFLVLGRAKRGGHDEFCALEIGAFSQGFVEKEMLDEDLDAHIHATQTGTESLFESFAAAEVDDVNRGTRRLGERHQVVDPGGFDKRRAAGVVPFGAGYSRSEELAWEF